MSNLIAGVIIFQEKTSIGFFLAIAVEASIAVPSLTSPLTKRITISDCSTLYVKRWTEGNSDPLSSMMNGNKNGHVLIFSTTLARTSFQLKPPSFLCAELTKTRKMFFGTIPLSIFFLRTSDCFTSWMCNLNSFLFYHTDSKKQHESLIENDLEE